MRVVSVPLRMVAMYRASQSACIRLAVVAITTAQQNVFVATQTPPSAKASLRLPNASECCWCVVHVTCSTDGYPKQRFSKQTNRSVFFLRQCWWSIRVVHYTRTVHTSHTHTQNIRASTCRRMPIEWKQKFPQWQVDIAIERIHIHAQIYKYYICLCMCAVLRFVWLPCNRPHGSVCCDNNKWIHTHCGARTLAAQNNSVVSNTCWSTIVQYNIVSNSGAEENDASECELWTSKLAREAESEMMTRGNEHTQFRTKQRGTNNIYTFIFVFIRSSFVFDISVHDTV